VLTASLNLIIGAKRYWIVLRYVASHKTVFLFFLYRWRSFNWAVGRIGPIRTQMRFGVQHLVCSLRDELRCWTVGQTSWCTSNNRLPGPASLYCNKQCLSSTLLELNAWVNCYTLIGWLVRNADTPRSYRKWSIMPLNPWYWGNKIFNYVLDYLSSLYMHLSLPLCSYIHVICLPPHCRFFSSSFFSSESCVLSKDPFHTQLINCTDHCHL
jgi:hypothetical protein